MNQKFKDIIKIKGVHGYYFYFFCCTDAGYSRIKLYISKDKDIYNVLIYTYYASSKISTIASTPDYMIGGRFSNYNITKKILSDNMKIAFDFLKYLVVNDNHAMKTIESILKNEYKY